MSVTILAPGHRRGASAMTIASDHTQHGASLLYRAMRDFLTSSPS